MDFYNTAESIEIQGHPITFYQQGQGEAMLFVHGITTYSFIWRKIIPGFTNQYRVIALDLLGCGSSAKPLTEDISLKRQAHLLADFLKALKIEKCHLVCHDVGGGIGQIFAVNYPKMLRSLTLINTVAYSFWPVQPVIAMRTPIIRQLAMATLDFGMFELIVKRGLYHKKKLTKELMELFGKPMNNALGRKGFLHFAKCLNNTNLTEIRAELRQLHIPVLIIRGEADVYLTAAISEKLHNEIPNSQLIKINSGGHFIQEDEPEMLVSAILNFINRE